MLGEISFAGKRAFNIKCEDTKKRILATLEHTYNFKILQKHHETFKDGHIGKLNANPHLISVKTNGNPYLLFLTRLNYVNQCIFVDKKIQQGYTLPRMILTRFSFADELFDGTVLDGEMINPDSSLTASASPWLFLISDMIGFRGSHLDNVNVVKRMNMTYSMLKSSYLPDTFDVCHFQVKRYFTYDDVATLVSDFLPRLPYTCRGLYFKPLFLKFNDILVNFDDSLVVQPHRLKIKDIVSQTFLTKDDIAGINIKQPCKKDIDQTHPHPLRTERCWWVRKTGSPDVYTLIDTNGTEEQQACVSTLKTSKMLYNLFKDKSVQDKVKMVCVFSDVFQKWVPTATC
jgi:hypothetical protein